MKEYQILEKVLTKLKDYKGVESSREVIGLKEVLSTPIENERENSLYFPLGKANGKVINLYLWSVANVLVSGSTGSGKSVFLHQMITSLIAKYSPEQVKLLLIDSKMVEFNCYEGLPHLLREPIYDYQETLDSLEYVIKLIEERYKKIFDSSAKDFNDYNEKAKQSGEEIMPALVVVIDEFADLVVVNKKRFEEVITAITAKGRGAGVHVIASTQRPSKSVITPNLKALMPTKIAFRVTTKEDSKVALGQVGAEKLYGYGDGLYKGIDSENAVNFQSAYVSGKEILEVVNLIKNECK